MSLCFMTFCLCTRKAMRFQDKKLVISVNLEQDDKLRTCFCILNMFFSSKESIPINFLTLKRKRNPLSKPSRHAAQRLFIAYRSKQSYTWAHRLENEKGKVKELFSITNSIKDDNTVCYLLVHGTRGCVKWIISTRGYGTRGQG